MYTGREGPAIEVNHGEIFELPDKGDPETQPVVSEGVAAAEPVSV